MLHAMIDLETLDVRPEAVVLSIGIALFNPNNPAEPPKPACRPAFIRTLLSHRPTGPKKITG